MVRIIQRLKRYFKSAFAPEKLKWNRIVADEKSGRGCSHCGRFGFYIHLPTSLREYWWGFYRCKGCKKEFRPKFTKGNLIFLLLLALIYFNYFGTRGFTYQIYISMVINFAFALGVIFIYSIYSRMSGSATHMISFSSLLGWGLVGAQIALAHHGEGVATVRPKDILYLTGSTTAFTLAGGSLLGLIPGVQTSFEQFLNFLLSDDSEPWVDPKSRSGLVVDEETKEQIGKSVPEDKTPGETEEETSLDSRRPDWADPEHERAQLDWYRTGLEDEQMRLESYLRHRQDDPGFDERIKDMRRSIDYYREKFNEQQGRMNKWAIDEKPHRQLERWDPFAVSEVERQAHQESARRARWQEAWNKFDKMRTGAEKRGHDLYGDPARWDKAMDNIFNDEGEVDYAVLNRARTVFQRSIQAHIDKVEGDISIMDQIIDPKHRHWGTDFAINTARDVKSNPVARIGIGVMFAGKSEAVFELLDQIERMHQYVEYHDKGGSGMDAVKGAFAWGVKEFAKDKTAWREMRTLLTGEVEMPNGKLRPAKKFDYAMSLLGAGLKTRDWDATIYKGKFTDIEAFGFGSKTAEDISGPDGHTRPGGGAPTDGDAPRVTSDGDTPRMTADGEDVRIKTDEVETRGDVPVGSDGGGKPPNISPDLSDDYKGLQQALANGDDGSANRYATRMLVKNYDEFNRLARNGTLDPDTVRRAHGMHQVIVTEGAAEGMHRTKKIGDLFGDQMDANGNVTSPSPIKHVWSPGSALEPFDPKNPRLPGDVDLTTVVDKKICIKRGVDPDDIQRLSAGHMRDGINQVARQKLGDDIGDYCNKTKVKPFEPGSAEEYHAPTYHETIEGRTINSRGDIVDSKTTLGKELWPGSKDISQTISQSKTGRAMVAADEHFQINKNIREFRSRPNVSEAEWVETARDLSKHMDRSQKGADWNTDDIDGSRLQLDEVSTPQQKVNKFKATYEAAKSGDPEAIKAAVKKHYDGDYDKYFEDIRESSKQMTRTKLEDGGKIFAPQAERLNNTGVKVPEENIIKHSKTPPKSSQEYLQRMGVDRAEQRQIQLDKQTEELKKGLKPEFRGRELPGQADKGWPSGDTQPWPAKSGSIRDGTFKEDEDWWPKKPDGKNVDNMPWPKDVETEEHRWIARDQELGKVDSDQRVLNQAEIQGLVRPPHLEKMAQDNPGFKALDDRVREAWRKAAGGIPDKNAPHGPYAKFKHELQEAGVSDAHYRAWNKAVQDGVWEDAPAKSVRLDGTQPDMRTQPGVVAPGPQPSPMASPDEPGARPQMGPATSTRKLVPPPQAAGPASPSASPAGTPQTPSAAGPEPSQPIDQGFESPSGSDALRPEKEKPQGLRSAGGKGVESETDAAAIRQSEDLLTRERALEEKGRHVTAREEALARREKELMELTRQIKKEPSDE